jgi:hypothetical protein
MRGSVFAILECKPTDPQRCAIKAAPQIAVFRFIKGL